MWTWAFIVLGGFALFMLGIRAGLRIEKETRHVYDAVASELDGPSRREVDEALVQVARVFELLHWALLPHIKDESDVRELSVETKNHLNLLRGAAERRLEMLDRMDRFRNELDDL